MASLNKCMVIGRLGQDPEVRYTKSNTAVATMSVATSDRYKDSSGEWKEKTEWHRIVAWGRLAEVCDKYLKKGSQVYFEGPIQTKQWEDKNGQKRYTTEIKALQLQMLDSKNERSGGGGGPDFSEDKRDSKPAKKSGDAVDFGEDFDDDELPF